MDREEPHIISVGLGELRVSRDPGACLVAHGLGSCVGVCAYDPVAKVGAMLHAMLPEHNGRASAQPTKYVDSGIRHMLEELASQGALRQRLAVYLTGGAHMLVAPGFKNALNIGARNADMAREVLEREGLRLAGADTGGHWGRTIKLYINDGKITVRSVGRGEHEFSL
ncbi:MAG TPA: chemotaxis protein CheD [Candidatus Hydrogenedentes bacterium]|nr:chemotaxis protein CheD [Candidatus Hydrogenedentota bacterium]